MNYRHVYHAGNPCDVIKHSVLTLLLSYLQQKDKGFAVLDTHAGCGLYDLTDPQAKKTGEAEAGVGKIWAQREQALALSAELKTYLDLLAPLNADGVLRYYPGSPLFTLKMLREQDRLIACELHPEDARALRRHVGSFPNAQLHARDGYEALRAFIPFEEKRGLVLIDPPFEKPDEFAQVASALRDIHARAPQTVVALWYPIKERPTLWRFHEELVSAKVGELWIAEFLFQPELRSDTLNGSGFVFMNMPWTLPEQLGRLFPALHDLWATGMKDSGTIIRPLADAS